MPRKKGIVPSKVVAKSWGSNVLKELRWFGETLGISWSGKVAYDMENYSTMELNPYKSITYTLTGEGPDGEKAEATILVDFKHDYEKPTGYDSRGQGYVLHGINPQVPRPAKDEWTISRSFLSVKFEGDELSSQGYDKIFRDVRVGKSYSGMERPLGIKELDWN